MITVGQLCDALNGLNSDTIIVISADEEGRYLAPLETIDCYSSAWDAENQDVGLRQLTTDNIRDGYTDEDVVNGPPCVVLWPA